MAEIKSIHGLLFNTKADWLVNTVNCVGVMGAGVALECKYRYPGLFEAYQKQCESGALSPGRLWCYRDSSPKILCFPTKADWKHPSRIDYIKSGLEKIAVTYKEKLADKDERVSIAMPHLGCSHGGLQWEEQVEPLVIEYLSDLPDLEVEVYSFDPEAEDSLYDKLEGEIRDIRRRQPGADDAKKEVARKMGLRTQAINRLFDAVDSGEIKNMLGLQRAPGIGDKTTEKIYEFLSRSDGSGDGWESDTYWAGSFVDLPGG